MRNRCSNSEKSCWTYTERKTRNDALSEKNKRLIYEFWLSPSNSRPTANKADVKRVRLEANVYVRHMKYVLEKSQAEVYADFRVSHADVKVSQRLFEKLKPFFVIPTRAKDRETCCCKQHVEARFVFKACMEYRKQFTPTSDTYPVYTHLMDVVDDTLCCKDSTGFNKLECAQRNCDSCGIKNFKISEQELDVEENAPDVSWMRYEYVNVSNKYGDRRKLMLVQKVTKPGELFDYFKQLLNSFAGHCHRSKWQAQQLKQLKENLPKNEVICIHDFSENYACKDNIEIQSQYFQRTEVSLHVSIIYRHPLPELGEDVDGGLIEEQLFVISPDLQHDHHFSHAAQQEISTYLSSLNYEVKHMHEFTDGCAAQYKSRHCFGDLGHSYEDFGYITTRNYFETSHAKGVQDAAGGLIKSQADLAVARGKASIQNAEQLFHFCHENLQTPKYGSCQRRIFRHIEDVTRDRERYYKSIPKIRRVHQVTTTREVSVVHTRHLSCYCDLQDSSELCANATYHDNSKLCMLSPENKRKQSGLYVDSQPTISNLLQPGTIAAVYTDDPDQDYYLVMCTDSETVLESNETDDWGITHLKGTHVIRGLYFDCENRDQCHFKIIKQKRVLIAVQSVLYICIEQPSKCGRIALTEDTHNDIIELCNKVAL